MTASPLRSRFGRWLVPAAAVVLVAGVSLAGSRMASADSDLAPRTAAELLADLQRARLDHLSGTVVQTADLGLPSLPGVSGMSGSVGAGASELTSIISGSHTWKVWYGGENQQRLALVGTLGESDIIHNGSDVWIWSSKAQTATHLVIDPAKAAAAKSEAGKTGGPLMTAGPTGTGLPPTPEDAAKAALAAIDPTTRAEVGPAVVVAGRTAYELVLTPKDSTTLVAQVRLAVDGERHLPLRVQVFSTKQSTPAIEVGFTSIDFSAPEARQFEFTPPPGTTVTEGMPEGLGDKALGDKAAGYADRAWRWRRRRQGRRTARGRHRLVAGRRGHDACHHGRRTGRGNRRRRWAGSTAEPPGRAAAGLGCVGQWPGPRRDAVLARPRRRRPRRARGCCPRRPVCRPRRARGRLTARGCWQFRRGS
jgi:outer membrane lipoprotein-sorting protein